IIGPSRPAGDSAAEHTTSLAHHLAEAGYEVSLVTWVGLAPSGPKPARGTEPSDLPDGVPFPRTVPILDRARPDTWVRTGRRLRDVDAVVIADVSPAMVPAGLALLRAAGALPGQGGPVHHGPQSVVLCQRLPDPGGPRSGARMLSRLLRSVDSVLVHGADQAAIATRLGAKRVAVAELPTRRSEKELSQRHGDGPTSLLVLGPVRGAAEIGLLLRAIRVVPRVRLTLAGELSEGSREVVLAAAADPVLAGRLEIREGQVPAEDLATLLSDHHVLVLLHRSALAWQSLVLAQSHGLPVLAPDLHPFRGQVRDAVDGLLVPPDDEPALIDALRRLGDSALREHLADGAQTPDLSGPWAAYLGVIETLSIDASTLAAAPGGASRVDGPRAAGDESGAGVRAGAGVDVARWSAARRRSAELLRRAASRARDSASAGHSATRSALHLVPARSRLDLAARDLPEWVIATDVLIDPEEVDDVTLLARDLGLPRSRDRVSTWAAIGALAAIIRVRDDGRRGTVIIDETGPRSLVSRWARAVGFAPVQIDFTGTHPQVAALDVDTNSLDVIVRIHPRGCDREDIDHVLEQAAWALRSGGLLIVTVPIGPLGAEGAMGPADVRGLLARADGLGFVLVGDLDGDVNVRMREASARARAGDAAYGLVRLTLRRR
ncbi:MAG: glycosyltransferase, partial [Dermatophilaceae bacterium]